MEEPLSQKSKIKIAYMNGIITKKEMKRLLKEDEKKEELIQSPKDQPDFYPE